MKVFLFNIKHYLPAVISGVLIALSFPKPDLSFLAWFALVPLLVFLHDKNLKKSFIAGFITGLVYFFSTLYWIYHSLNHYGSIPLIPSLLSVLLLCLYLALYPGLFAFFYSYITKSSPLPSMVTAPLLWTSLEYVRSYFLSGFPWSSLGYSQYTFLHFIQIADITGIYGISFFLVAFNGAIADGILIKKRRLQRPLMPLYPTVLSLSIYILLFVGIFVYGNLRLNHDFDSKKVKIVLVQGNIEQDKKWDPLFQKYVMDSYKNLTLEALRYDPEIIIWPETALPFYFGKDKALTEELLDFQRQTGSYLLTGSMLIKNNRDPKSTPSQIYTNSAILFDKDSKVSYIYDKIHLVPFGEYVPLRSVLFFINKLTYGIGDYTPGSSHLKAITPYGSFATVICYEIIFPGLVRKFFLKGGDFLVNITNDAWFGTTSGPYQHFNMAVFRAIENRKPVIRAANAGISGFIDSKGIIGHTSSLFHRTSLYSEIKTNPTITFYTKYGDIFPYFAIVLSIILLFKKDK